MTASILDHFPSRFTVASGFNELFKAATASPAYRGRKYVLMKKIDEYHAKNEFGSWRSNRKLSRSSILLKVSHLRLYNRRG